MKIIKLTTKIFLTSKFESLNKTLYKLYPWGIAESPNWGMLFYDELDSKSAARNYKQTLIGMYVKKYHL